MDTHLTTKDKELSKHAPAPWTWTPDLSNQNHEHNQWLCSPNQGVLLHGGPWPVDAHNARLIAAAPKMLEALVEISKGDGPFSRNHLQHAVNCIENMKAIAVSAIAEATMGVLDAGD